MSSSLESRIREANEVIIANGQLDAVDKFFTADYVVHLTDQELSGGHRTVQKVLGGLMRAFSNVEVKVHILLVGEDRIAWQRTMTGTQTGAYKGFPASGKKIIWREMVVSQFQGSLISEEWLSTDLAERLLLSRKRRT